MSASWQRSGPLGDGSPLGDAFQVSTAGAAQFSTDLAVNPSTNIFLSVWPDGRNFPESNVDIFGQLIAASSVAALDHFLCYKVKEETKLGDIFVSLEDQFGSDPDVRVKKAKTICVPVDKNGEGINNPDLHLVCYKVKSELKPKKDVLVTNQFGEQILEVKKPDLLCVPSSKEILGDSVGDRDDDGDDKEKDKDDDDDDDD